MIGKDEMDPEEINEERVIMKTKAMEIPNESTQNGSNEATLQPQPSQTEYMENPFDTLLRMTEYLNGHR